jgi:uncharacterized protein DUF1275
LVALGLLTLVTGLVEAACYLGLGRVFTANMTGNVVLLAFGAAGAQGLPVLAPTVSLVVFLAGATAGGRLAHRLVGPADAEVPTPMRRRWVTITLLGELGLVAVAGVVALGSELAANRPPTSSPPHSPSTAGRFGQPRSRSHWANSSRPRWSPALVRTISSVGGRYGRPATRCWRPWICTASTTSATPSQPG